MSQAKAERPRVSVGRRLFRMVRNVLAVVGLVAIIYHFCFDATVIVSNSMAPTLCGDGGKKSDRVLLDRFSYRFRRPKRWELVQYVSADGVLVIKRVVGLPGETVSIDDHRLMINGREANVPASLGFLKYYGFGNLRLGKTVECREGYFVLGDASNDSADSRYEGPIARERLLARAWITYRPWSRMRFLTP